MVIPPDEFVWFKVNEWITGTTAEDKKKDISWIWQEHDRKIIIWKKIIPANKIYAIKLPKKLCGSYSYYLEASFSGKTDSSLAGLYISGLCDKSIVSSKWCTTIDGKDVRKTTLFSYGNVIHLNLSTEGLNGDRLIVEVYNLQKLISDKLIFTFTNVKVRDGEVNLEIKNTSAWQGLISNIQSEEKFYIKVKDQATGKYILDSNKDAAHARYLRIKNKLIANSPQAPVNNTASKTGQPNVKAVRYEPCKFEQIYLTETNKKDGKIVQTKTQVFDNGKALKGVNNPERKITKTIFFDFDSDVITKDGNTKLNNTLNFLLEHEHSTITIEGYACVIGKMKYNQSLSQNRSDAVRKFFTDGKLDVRRIVSKGKGEINATDNKGGADNLKYKDEKKYIEARRVDISFQYFGHDAKTIIFETIAPSQNKDILIDITAFQTNACFRDKEKHIKQIKVTSSEYKTPLIKAGSSLVAPIHSALSVINPAPMQYIWPRWNLINGAKGAGIDSAEYYNIYVNSCRYYSENPQSTLQIKAYPDIKWTLEFKWNHKQSFAYTYGNKMHPFSIKNGRKKAIGSVVDGDFAREDGEMDQSFELSLEAEWDEKRRKLEIGTEFGEKIAKTLSNFVRLKKIADSITNSPVNGGKFSFEIKPPAVAISIQWFLEKVDEYKNQIGTNIKFGIETKPLIDADIIIDLWQIVTEFGANAICPGAGKVINFISKHLEGNVGIKFEVIFNGSINVSGEISGNTLTPKNTKGKLAVEGKVQVTLELKAWATAEYGIAGFDGSAKANANTYLSAGIKAEIAKDGVVGYPELEFGGIVAKYVVIASIKFGVFKETFENNGQYVIVQKCPVEFKKAYLLGPY
ncbi:OmpA family protein [Flavobacterium ardleyense]|uniref:OmpA family protein n=1 Tax=Flavobacterium ardleyense TaxID=2038737 RepID=A0ABW5Z7F0_9FLAO